jgi:hypothetical protein
MSRGRSYQFCGAARSRRKSDTSEPFAQLDDNSPAPADEAPKRRRCARGFVTVAHMHTVIVVASTQEKCECKRRATRCCSVPGTINHQDHPQAPQEVSATSRLLWQAAPCHIDYGGLHLQHHGEPHRCRCAPHRLNLLDMHAVAASKCSYGHTPRILQHRSA